MTKEEILKNAEATVKRLILQYEEYANTLNSINRKENNKLALISKVSKKTNLSISQIMEDQDSYEEITKLNNEIDLLKLDLQQISDEMTFPNPIIWMMYKYKAYKGKSNEISNLRQFRNHCTPEGYICTERYKFLNDYLIANHNKDLSNISKFPDDLELNKLYESDLLIDLCNDLSFMQQWKENEYLKTDGKVNKWETVIKDL
jgi:hypothetical protein